MMDKKNEKSKPDLIGPHGGYRNLKSYQTAEIIYDATAVFCDLFVSKRSRTHDQMVQAARSGKQNIAEGSMVSGTSKKNELKLIGVARASLEEANYLLDQQLRQLEKQFLEEGGFTEKLYQARQQAKRKLQ